MNQPLPIAGKRSAGTKIVRAICTSEKWGYGRGDFDVANPRVRYLKIRWGIKAVMAQQRFLN